MVETTPGHAGSEATNESNDLLMIFKCDRRYRPHVSVPNRLGYVRVKSGCREVGGSGKMTLRMSIQYAGPHSEGPDGSNPRILRVTRQGRLTDSRRHHVARKSFEVRLGVDHRRRLLRGRPKDRCP